jgi:hypothetical protein
MVNNSGYETRKRLMGIIKNIQESTKDRPKDSYPAVPKGTESNKSASEEELLEHVRGLMMRGLLQ